MKKNNNELQNIILDIGDSVHDALAARFDSAYEDALTVTETEAFGDTYVPAYRYIDDDDEVEIREDFENEYEFDEVIRLLKNDDQFRSAVMDLVKYIAWKREP